MTWIRDIRDGKFKPTVDQVRSMIKGITPKEIERAIRWGYEHGEEGGKMPEKQGHGVQKVHINPYFDEKTAQSKQIQMRMKTLTLTATPFRTKFSRPFPPT